MDELEPFENKEENIKKKTTSTSKGKAKKYGISRTIFAKSNSLYINILLPRF
ncbi:hypothetical protein [Bacillus cereus]|uniref:hypothetical protein n=1 Tax=Bacillus cereus TaxID=1396 RepID=UPI0018CEAC9B|nr:hypothetical protein [Bacillus cereus]